MNGKKEIPENNIENKEKISGCKMVIFNKG